MTNLTVDEKRQLTELIRDCEANTDGELVTVICRESDNYLYIPTLYAALFSFLVSGIIVLVAPEFQSSLVYSIQITVFLGLSLLFRWSPVKLRLVPWEVKQRRASRKAHELFFIEGLHLTKGRHGMMLFVSVAERYVEIIADSGISEKVDQSVWDDVIADFSKQLKKGAAFEGYRLAIEKCGKILAQHCPATEKDKNEIPNHLIEL